MTNATDNKQLPLFVTMLDAVHSELAQTEQALKSLAEKLHPVLVFPMEPLPMPAQAPLDPRSVSRSERIATDAPLPVSNHVAGLQEASSRVNKLRQAINDLRTSIQ